MIDSNQDSTVLIITEDVELLSSLLESNSTGLQFISRESTQTALDDPEVLSNNNIVIIDIDSIGGGTSAVIEQALNLKKSDPTQVLMMVGEPEPLGEILRSNIQPLIYRAFNKPISPNQIFLSFGSAAALHEDLVQKQAAGEDLLTVGPLENRTNVDSIADQQKNKSAIYAAVGVVTLAVIGWLLFGNNSKDLPEQTIAQPSPTEVEVYDTAINTNDDISTINRLNQEAAKALLEDRQISPEGDNALYYYDQVLAIDPYDLTAYEGKKALATSLKSSYDDLVNNAEFDRALATIDTLQKIEPLDASNYELREKLEAAINKQAASEKSAAVLERIEAKAKSDQVAAVAALQKEKALLASIDQAIAADILLPPQDGNAYDLVSEAKQNNSISKANLAPRISTLNDRLIHNAEADLSKSNLKKAEKNIGFVKQLDVDPDGLAKLTAAYNELNTEESSAGQTNQEGGANQQTASIASGPRPAQVKIIPAKIITRQAPRYPSRALDREIEGWVSIGFRIDTDGVPQDIKVVESDPKTVFDDAAIAAVKKWRFSPAINELTQLPVESTVDSTKLQFRIDQN